MDYVTVAFASHAGTKTQDWPKQVSVPELRALCLERAEGWVVDASSTNGRTCILHLQGVEITYKEMKGTDEWVFAHVDQYVSVVPPFIDQTDHANLASELRDIIPGLGEMVCHPCNCWVEPPRMGTVWKVIQHLNDAHHPRVYLDREGQWTRERIAQWTEELPFDMTVHPEMAEQRRASGLTPQQEKALSSAIGEQTLAIADAWKIASQAIQPVVKSFHNLAKTYEMLTGQPYPDDDEEEA